MSRTLGVLSCLALAAVLATPARAQVGGNPFELSGSAGLFHYDARARMHDGPALGLGAGWRFQPWLTVEGNALFGPSKADTVPGGYGFDGGGAIADGPKHNFLFAGVDLRWNLRPAQNRIVPFLLTGIGVGRSHGGTVDASGESQKLERGAPSIGVGTLYNVLNQRTYVRLQVRDVFFREAGASEFSNHVAVTVGLHYVLKGRVLDQDRDHVRDWLDECPDTPIGCTVDAHGCPHDSDGDGVCDGVDKCPNTPKGCKVNAEGCTTDSDGDGVCDDLDKCPDTPKGCTVDANGCPSDADGDGVCDGVDLCPNTPAGLRVDEHGCPIEVREREVQLLNTGTIRLQNIEFDTNKATLKPASEPILHQVGDLLVSYPQLKIEIGGHTDDRGAAAKNMKLSQARADSVRAWLERHYHFPADQFTTKGYGPTRPIAPNTSAAGRARNRRVEFKVLNTEQLRIERERRHYLLRGEGVPRDTTGGGRPPDGAPTPPPPSPPPAPPDTSGAPGARPPAPTTEPVPIPPPAPDTSGAGRPHGAVPDSTRKP